MKKTLAHSALAVVIGASAIGQASEPPAECKSRLGSPRACFQSKANFYVMKCELAGRVASAQYDGGQSGAYESAGKCGPVAKSEIRPYFDALVSSIAKKPPAVAAAKKSLAAFIAVVDDPPGSPALRASLKAALADLEVEAP